MSPTMLLTHYMISKAWSYHEMSEASHRMNLCVVFYKEKTNMCLEFKFIGGGIMSLNVIVDTDAGFTFNTS